MITMRFLLPFVFLFATVQADSCDLTKEPKTWASIYAHNVVSYAIQTPVKYPEHTFCYQNDMSSKTITVHSHVHIARNNMVYNDTVTTAPPSVSNCANFNSQLVYCKNHCIDTPVLKAMIDIAVNNSLPSAVSSGIYQDMGGPPDWTVSTFQVDPSPANLEIDYEYYSDRRFCAVQLKANNTPYSLLIIAAEFYLY
ncbi:unnamed protein product [Caenorhabditis auriculariae]|uniref:Uncharacterized protein n=1 Tax=Caenorhabditis auriculariae TaxID=2777116 RepID=A0A8S1GSC0_9PELO|nr:unnamed protein product [Caenorhabditis auriculariae]